MVVDVIHIRLDARPPQNNYIAIVDIHHSASSLQQPMPSKILTHSYNDL